MTILGNVRQSLGVAVGNGPSRDVDTVDQDVASQYRPKAGQSFDQLRLPISFDASEEVLGEYMIGTKKGNAA